MEVEVDSSAGTAEQLTLVVVVVVVVEHGGGGPMEQVEMVDQV